MLNNKVLVIEDDPDILELVQYNLEKSGFNVSSAQDGEKGITTAFKVLPDIILLDIMLPGINGLEVCKKLKQNDATKNIPIIMLTAKGEESDIVEGLELGADDYITKPFSPKEVIARLQAVLRRYKIFEESKKSDDICFGPISINKERHEVKCNNNKLILTLAEFNLLKTLITKPGRVFTREQLLGVISDDETFLIDRNVDVHVRALRKKLGDEKELIMTVRGVGYKCKD